ncbi:MAG: TatD family hydrolase [Pseudomonadota bacterium]
MLVDSHCHLDFADFAEDLDGVIERASDAGVARILSICTLPSRFEVTRRIADRYEQVFCAVGVHPHEAAKEGEISVEDLVALTAGAKTVAIGETGLDYHYDHSPRAIQADSFRRHCQAARLTGLPIIVHTREAEDDTIAILREEAAGRGAYPLRGVIHCFSGSRWLADQAMDIGFYVSLSGIFTFKKTDDVRHAVANVPLDRLLVETDAPYLAPVPKRGKRNEPSFVAHTAAHLAAERRLTPEAVAERTTANFFELFSKTAPITRTAAVAQS